MTDFNKENNRVEKKSKTLLPSRSSIDCASLTREILNVLSERIGSSPDSIVFDRLQRFRTNEDRRGEKSGWYRAYQNDGSFVVVLFGDWRKSPYNTWHNRQNDWKRLDSGERKRITEHIESSRKKYEAEQKIQKDIAAARARKIFDSAIPVQGYDNFYLAEKNVPSFGLRRTRNNTLLIPITNINGEIRSLLFISKSIISDSTGGHRFIKKFLPCGEKSGCFFRIPGDESGPLCIGEGYSTCASIHLSTGYEVFCALDCYNLKAIAVMLRKMTRRKIIICADNDMAGKNGNTGIRKAMEAAWESGALVAVPKHDGNCNTCGSIDFNDLYCLRGQEEVKKQVNEARDPDSINIELVANNPDEDILFLPSVLPEMGHEAFYGLAGEAVRLACRSSEADPVAVLATFIVRFGVEIGRSAYIAVGDTNHYANEYVAVIGRSSKARKGTSAKPVDRFFDIEDAAKSSPGPLSTGEGIVYAVRNEIREWNTNKKEYQVSDPGVSDKRLYVNDPELGAALKSMKREGNTLSANLRYLFDSGSADPLTKTSKISTTNAHVGILAHCTEIEMRALLPHLEAHTGFANRFLWISVTRKKIVPFPEPMPDHEVSIIKERIVEASLLARGRGRMVFDREAEEVWRKVYPELSAEIPGSIGSTLGRAEAHVMRLALIYALLDKSDCIKKIYLDAAMAFWKYCEASVRHVFQETQLSELATKIYDIVRKKSVSSTELSKLLSNNYSKDKIENALKELESVIISEKIKNSGKKPTTIFRLKPVSEGFTDKKLNSSIPEDYSNNNLINLPVKSGGYLEDSLSSLNSYPCLNNETPKLIFA